MPKQLISLVVMVMAVAGVATARPAATPEACKLVKAPGLGEACKVDGGYQVTLPDGYSFFTHGGDFFPPTVLGHQGTGSWPLRKPACVTKTSNEFHTRMFYGVPKGQPDRYSSLLSEMRNMVYQSNGKVYSEAKLFGRKMDIRFACSGSSVSVTRIKLSTTLNETNVVTVIKDMRAAGWVNPLAKYWLWLDGNPPGSPGGIATASRDDRRDPDNAAGFGADYNVTFGYRINQGGQFIMLHEGSHNYGAVQSTAPHASGNGHCNDGTDVMCYADGGSTSAYKANVCSESYYDCKHDDYFNPKPKSTSYLGRKWNLGAPANRFYKGCNYVTGVLTAGTAGQTAAAVAGPADQPDPTKNVSWANRSFTSCSGRPFVISAVPAVPKEADTVFATAAPAEPTQVGCVLDWDCYSVIGSQVLRPAPLVDVDVCFYAGSSLKKCYDSGKFERGTVPSGTTSARIFLKTGVNAIYVLNAV